MSPQGPKFHIDVEGTVYDWEDDTITVAQIRELGTLPADLMDNSQRELEEDEVVGLRPGLGFSKKVRFKRG